MTDTTTNGSRRWSDSWPVRFLLTALALLWTGAIAVGAHHQGRISGIETESARNTAEINAKLDSIENRLRRVEDKLDR